MEERPPLARPLLLSEQYAKVLHRRLIPNDRGILEDSLLKPPAPAKVFWPACQIVGVSGFNPPWHLTSKTKNDIDYKFEDTVAPVTQARHGAETSSSKCGVLNLLSVRDSHYFDSYRDACFIGILGSCCSRSDVFSICNPKLQILLWQDDTEDSGSDWDELDEFKA